MLAWMWSKRNTPKLLVGLQTFTATLKIWLLLGKLEIALPQDPAILFLVIYPQNASPSHKDTFSTMLIAPIFNIQKLEKNGCPSTEKWNEENVFHFHNGILLSY